MQDLVTYYRQKYGLDIDVLKSIPARSPGRGGWFAQKQVQAEPLVATLHSDFPEVASDPGAVLIGLATVDLYPLTVNWRYAFGWRDINLHTAVVSSARMGFHYSGEPHDASDPVVRMRKMITKDIGVLYYGLPSSSNPHSALYDHIMGMQELDRVSEDFLLVTPTF